MTRPNVNDLIAFLAVARERSFTRAAAQLGVSQSALSQTIRGLEARLRLRLLTRTTRRVASTEAGERLLRTVGPRLEEIDAELAALSALREKPAGTVRITADGEEKVSAKKRSQAKKRCQRRKGVRILFTKNSKRKKRCQEPFHEKLAQSLVPRER